MNRLLRAFLRLVSQAFADLAKHEMESGQYDLQFRDEPLGVTLRGPTGELKYTQRSGEPSPPPNGGAKRNGLRMHLATGVVIALLTAFNGYLAWYLFW